jgi:hypothetical protein
MSELFLSDAELSKLTGFAWKSKQIQWLKAEGIPFRTSATGHPVVTRAAIEGRPQAATEAAQHNQPVRWTPRVVGA